LTVSKGVGAAYDWPGPQFERPTDFTGGTKPAWEGPNALRPGEGQT